MLDEPTFSGLTHAAIVMAVVMSRSFESGVVAYWVVPLNWRALPIRPGTQVGAATVVASLAGRAPVSWAIEPLVSSIAQ